MTVKDLGRLERVDLRDIWLSEASDFTPWLARKENLDILGQTLVIDLELEAQERPVGPFRADILCKDIGSDRWVLIENPLERTDHNHLGQLLTYASGLEAVTIVWIAAHFTEEHRSTLDWLNRITDGSFRFFGLEVELWRIGDSPPARVLATGEALAKAAAPSGARVVELALESLVANSHDTRPRFFSWNTRPAQARGILDHSIPMWVRAASRFAMVGSSGRPGPAWCRAPM